MKASKAVLSFALPLLVLAAACSESTTEPPAEGGALQPGYALLGDNADVQLSVEADAFAAGAPITLVLQNHSSGEIGFNLCFHAIERRTGDTWTAEADDRICTTHLDLLAPGGSHRYDTALPSALAAGEYRFRVALELMGQQTRRDQVSGAFTIGG